MVLRIRVVFIVLLIIAISWFLYLTRAVLTPIVLAGIFAYIFNPLVNFFYHRVKLPRALSILIIYTAIIATIVTLGIFLTRQLTNESSDLRGYIQFITTAAESQIKTLPEWIQPAAHDALISLEKSRVFSPQYLFTFFPEAISKVVSILIFLFSGYYFLKEGPMLLDKMLAYVPNAYKLDIEILFRKMSNVFGGYLRGQFFLILLVSLILFICLSIIGVRFSLLLAIFSGIAEVVPIIGPIVATLVAIIIVLISGVHNFNLDPFTGTIVVAVMYFVVRQTQDYFITPYVMGKITKLHPFIVFFAVLSGGHLFGLLGVLLAIPIAAMIKIILEFAIDKINDHSISS